MRETLDTLESLTRVVTAFTSWPEFAASMGKGYVPTLYGRTRRGRMLARMLKALGYRVFTG